jgi:hypothetical protein
LDSDYPADLPEAWRLAYFANAFRAVLVPGARWQAATLAEIRSWCEDTPLGFRFYLEWDPAVPANSRDTRLAPLAGRCGGLVCRPSRTLGVLEDPGPWPVMDPGDHPLGEGGCAWPVPAQAVSDMRAARGWIEQRVQEAGEGPILALLGACPFADLERWQTLTELLGLA